MGNLYLEKIGKNEWHFSWKKDISETIVEMFFDSMDVLENGNVKKAIKSFPLCKKILLEDNPKKPKQVMEGYISVGGEDQAYYFWEEQGQVWKDDELRKWLKI